MRIAHLDDGKGNTLCGEPWQDWQDPTQSLSRADIDREPNRGVRLALMEEWERRRQADMRAMVRQCQACRKWMMEHAGQ